MRLIRALSILLLCCSSLAWAHPEDEFCDRDSGLDPELCAALAAANSSTPTPGAATYGRTEVTVQLDRPWHETTALYLRLGYKHILPGGLDHILFVLALLLASTRLRPLIIQVSVFTVAHTLTLALAALGLVRVAPGIVEPLIAISIAFVAIEDIVFRDMTRWRPLIVFGFGLFHGLGFADVLLDLGLPKDQFLTSLVSFNIGVELGQLTIILAAWLLLHRLFSRAWYRHRIVIPAALLIAITGAWWAIERIFLTTP